MSTALYHRRVVLVVLLVAAAAGAIRAQDSPLTLSVDEGTITRPIARRLNGRWVSAVACAPAGSALRSPSRRERLSVIGGPAPQTVQPVTPGGEDWLRLTPSILLLVERREQQERLTQRTTAAHTAVDYIYRTDRGSDRIYYFEASRRIAASPDVDADTDPPGTLRIAVSGFLRDGAGGPVSVASKSELRWEQDGLAAGPPSPDLEPLGVLPDGARSFWVMKGQSGTATWYAIYEVLSDTVRTVLTARVSTC